MDQYIIPIAIGCLTGTALVVVFLVWLFGKFLFTEKSGGFADKNGFLDRRNDFWQIFQQVFFAVFIVCVIGLLLLTKVITAEAGLPILSAVSGFAIAKGTSAKNNNRSTNEAVEPLDKENQ